jgi:hypothetical protein
VQDLEGWGYSLIEAVSTPILIQDAAIFIHPTKGPLSLSEPRFTRMIII